MRLNPLPPPYLRENSSAKKRKIKVMILLLILLVIGIGILYYLASDKKPVDETKPEDVSIVKRESKLVKAHPKKKKPATTLTKEEKKEALEQEKHQYLFSSDKERLTEEYLDQWDMETIQLVKNEIYARHGYVFRDEELQEYFSSKDWYEPNPEFAPSLLNDIEKENLKIILQYMEKVESLDNRADNQ